MTDMKSDNAELSQIGIRDTGGKQIAGTLRSSTTLYGFRVDGNSPCFARKQSGALCFFYASLEDRPYIFMHYQMRSE